MADAATSFAAITVGVAVFFAMRRDFAFCAVFLAGATFALAVEILFCTAFFIDADFTTDGDFVTDIEAAPAATLLVVDADFAPDVGFLAGALFVAVFFLGWVFLERGASFLMLALEALAVRFLCGVTLALEFSLSALA